MSESLHWESPRVSFALEAVRDAARMARQIQIERADLALSKEDRSPVTVADFSVQAVIARRLEETFPDEPVVAEEDAEMLVSKPLILERVQHWVGRVYPDVEPRALQRWIDRGTSEAASRFWTLDPIDGTKGFLRGDQYAVALAYIEDGQVLIGVLGCPNLKVGDAPTAGADGSLILAVRGKGCQAQPLTGSGGFTALHVSQLSDIRRARVLRSVEAGHTNISQFDRLIERMGVQVPPVCLDSQAKYGTLAAGGGELMLRLLSPSRPGYREKIWDQAAGSIVVEEAGGRVTDLRGHPLDFSCGRRLEKNEGILASNGLLHEAALDTLNSMGVAG